MPKVEPLILFLNIDEQNIFYLKQKLFRKLNLIGRTNFSFCIALIVWFYLVLVVWSMQLTVQTNSEQNRSKLDKWTKYETERDFYLLSVGWIMLSFHFPIFQFCEISCPWVPFNRNSTFHFHHLMHLMSTLQHNKS